MALLFTVGRWGGCCILPSWAVKHCAGPGSHIFEDLCFFVFILVFCLDLCCFLVFMLVFVVYLFNSLL